MFQSVENITIESSTINNTKWHVYDIIKLAFISDIKGHTIINQGEVKFLTKTTELDFEIS